MKCSPCALEAAVKRSDTPQDVVALIKKCNITKQQKQQTLVYMTCDGCHAVDKTGQCREFEAYDDKCVIDHVYNVCNTPDGYVFIKEEHSREKSTGKKFSSTSIFKYDAIEKRTSQLPGVSVMELDYTGYIKRRRRRNVVFSIIHKDTIHTISRYKQDQILSYDMKDHSWSKTPFPKESLYDRWTPAVAGDDLFFMNGQLHLYRLRQGKLERIHSELNESNSDDVMFFFSMTGAHRWLYIFAAPFKRYFYESDDNDEDDEDGFKVSEVHCYDTASGIWTKVPVDFKISDSEAACPSSSVMFANKIYFLHQIDDESIHRILYEYNLVNDSVTETTRPNPDRDFYLAVKDVSEEMLEAEIKARIVSDSGSDHKSSVKVLSDGETDSESSRQARILSDTERDSDSGPSVKARIFSDTETDSEPSDNDNGPGP